MKQRIVYIDRLKGFAIFLVVLGHVIQKHTVDSTSNPLFEIIYSFHMPFFFFLSGYIANKTTHIATKKDYWFFIKKKTVSLLIPFFVWSIIIEPYFMQTNASFSIVSFEYNFINAIAHPGFYWFLIYLFEIMIIYLLFFMLSNIVNNKGTVIVDFVILMGLLMPLIVIAIVLFDFSLTIFVLYAIFFFVGIFLSKYETIMKMACNKWTFVSSVMIFILLVGYYHSTAPGTLILKLLKVSLIAILSLSATISLYNLSKRLELPAWFDKFWVTMGKSTIVIYVTPIELLSKSMVLPVDFSLLVIALIAILISIIQMYISFGVGKLVETMPVLNLLLYGKLIKNRSK